MKKILLLILAIFMFASCSTTHKVKTSTVKTVDSTTVAVKDTSSTTKAQTYNDNFVAKGVDVTFDYNNDDSTGKVTPATPGDSVAWNPIYLPNKQGKAINSIIQQAIAKNGDNGNLSRITVHIDSLGNSDVGTVTTTASTGKDSVKTNVKSTEHTTVKDKTTTGMSGWLIIIIAVVVIGGLVYFAFRLKII